ncbi:uncharacterized protein SPAPADRAFT_67782 [Spathaspora passalidarum NRRL Y-27907]|uniref:Maltose/galactoside acetyltransferase domain-containing protein n=1 Tax=Spathaspora passalidarum (strain NRRL Y-27907 / 11-Y1) TaxID=619300 RepID=G3ARF1_SPAPN|nr:uncharacterized protein SPAPADRAFT_67782 [Spathaspora passalidarum NRRL Y-27907]EGW31758.1 hypothetical protein SPAPADRAFT_67782 [Spathaspora passalidarum NRRL Y-27907]
MPKFKSKEDFCKQTNIRGEINKELVEFAYKNLNHIPSKGNENYERMISGLIVLTFKHSYNAYTKDMQDVRMSIRDTILDYGKFRHRDYKTTKDYLDAKREHLRSFIGHVGDGAFMEYPVYFDYGFNTYIGKRFFSNYNLTILDVSIVKIGDNVMCGSNVSILTPSHPTDPTLRSGLQNGLPVTIGNNVWLGAGSTVLPGVTIGDGCVIGAGCVVNKDIPANSIVVGVPGRVVKTMDPRDPDFDVHACLEQYGMALIK